MSYIIHHATTADCDDLADLFCAYLRFYGVDDDTLATRLFLEERVGSAESVALLARTEPARAVGFAHLYPSFSSLRRRRIYVLNDLFVAPAERGNGLGELLLCAATRFCAEAGAASMSLSTQATNIAARSLYERLGWKEDKEFITYEFALPGAQA